MIKNKQESEAEEILSAFNGRGTMYIQPAAPKEVIILYVGKQDAWMDMQESLIEKYKKHTNDQFYIIVEVDYKNDFGVTAVKL